MSYGEFIIILMLLVVICQRGIKLLTLKEIKKVMGEITDAVAAIANDVTELQQAQQRVIDLLNKPNPEVQAAVAALQNADAGFDAIRDALNAAGTIPVPTPEPAPEPNTEQEG